MRKPIKKIKNLQNRDYVNMYIVYLLFLKNFEILRNIAIIYKKLPSATPEGIIRYKLDTGLHCFYLPYFAIFRNTFRNILKFLSKSFEIISISKYFEIFRNIRNISCRSQFFRKISACNFFRKISYIYFADVWYFARTRNIHR